MAKKPKGFFAASAKRVKAPAAVTPKKRPKLSAGKVGGLKLKIK